MSAPVHWVEIANFRFDEKNLAMARDEDVSSAGGLRDLRLVTYSEALQGTFGRMTPSDWNHLLDSAASLKFNNGQVVLGQRTTSKGVYIIAEGHVRIEYTDASTGTSSEGCRPGEPWGGGSLR